MDSPSQIATVAAIASAASAIAAAVSVYFAWQAVRTARGERRDQRDDVCLTAVSELQSAVNRCLSAVGGKRGWEIWDAYTDAWNHQTRFRPAYKIACRYHTGVSADAPAKIDQLLDERLRAMAISVAYDGRDPDEKERAKMAAELKAIVENVWKQIGAAS